MFKNIYYSLLGTIFGFYLGYCHGDAVMRLARAQAHAFNYALSRKLASTKSYTVSKLNTDSKRQLIEMRK
jgi:hydrogenase/urease accessory protein HupE